ncbi:MAG TPA: hypothetical protein VKN14_11530 [Flavobacteriaceae bacterium]|nr:hypothetical protein [Flavobacteriaceae bacterium]
MSANISRLVQMNFNTSITETLDLPDGEVRINVIFKIDKQGKIFDIKARSSHSDIEKEAIRVMELVPQMERAGYINDKPVIVPYSLPIIFKVNNTKNKKFPVFRGCNENLSYEYQKKCTVKKVKDFLRLSFNMELADKLFPTEKSTQFKVDFVVNKKGKVENINAKAHKREIAVEAISILKRLPKFKSPGYLNDEPVDTPFSILVTINF